MPSRDFAGKVNSTISTPSFAKTIYPGSITIFYNTGHPLKS